MKFEPDKSFGYPVLRNILEGDDHNELDYQRASFDPAFDPQPNVKKETVKISCEVGLRVPELKKLFDDVTNINVSLSFNK